MTTGATSRRWVPRLIVEAVVVVFSILLALAVDAWRQAQVTEERVQESLRSLRSELLENREKVRENRSYHAALADTLFALEEAGREVPPPGVPPGPWLRPSSLLSNAWAVATTSGTAGDMPHSVAVAVARAYQEQETYLEQRQAVVTVVYGAVMGGGSPSLRRLYPPLAGIISDVANREAQLLDAYESALAALGGSGEAAAVGGAS